MSEKAQGTPWLAGTRRVGDVLEVRDRWQGLAGPNAWLAVLLAAGAVASASVMVEAASRDRLGIAVITLLLFAALIVVVFRFYPMVRFGPETIRWRNRFRFKVVPTGSVRRLGVENFNSKAWVPVVVAYLDRGGFRRQSARFVATFSYRRDVAQVIAKEVLAWASEHAIPADLPPDLMVWRIKQPETVGSTNY